MAVDDILEQITFYHHGVKGQKWGIRRYQNEDGSYTALGKKRIKQLSSTSNDKIKDKDVIKISNQTFYRISRNKKDDADTRFVSYRPNDRNFYKGRWGVILRENDPNAKIYEQTYKQVRDILVPSAKTRREILSSLLYDDDVIKEIARDETGNVNQTYYKNIIFNRNINSEKKNADYVSGWASHKPLILQKYGQKILENGFNATVDDNGRTVGEMPLILFTANKDLIQTGSELVDKNMELYYRSQWNPKAAEDYRKKTASAYNRK